MAVALSIETDKLLKFAAKLGDMPRRNKIAISRALNQVGDGVVRQVTQSIEDQTGIPAYRIADMIVVRNANPNRLTYDITLPKGLTDEEPTDLEKRDFPKRDDDDFQEGSLVNVVTMGDDRVCMICEEIAEANPYTIEEARTQIHHGATIGLNNCRCLLTPARMLKKLAVTVGSGKKATDQRFTMKQLSEMIQTEMAVSFKVSD